MALSKDNVSVKAFLIEEDFAKSKNSHKYVLLWSTKFYRFVNKILRNNDIEEVLNKTKYTKRYICKMVKYFFKYGLYKEAIINKATHLYRGIDKDFDPPPLYTEQGFMATSISKLVSQNFAGKDGQIISFETKKLPKDTPFVLIDESIDRYLAEQEVLFLPGTIKLKQSSNSSTYISTYTKAYYKMNPIFKDINNREIHSGGGMSQPITPPDLINLKGKHIVWWRAIKGRPVEIVGRMAMPRKSEDVERFFNDHVLPHDDKFDMKTNFIPEYADIKKKKMENWRAVTKEEHELYQSYMVHMAIYHPRKKQVLTIHYGIYAEIFNEELFIQEGTQERTQERTQEVKDAILKYCAWLKY